MTPESEARPALENTKRKQLLQSMLARKGLQPAASRSGAIEPRKDDDVLNLSSAQQRLWFLEEFTADTAAYVFCNKVDLCGPLDIDALTRAFQAIVDRHEIFRTCYLQQDGIPYQSIHEAIKIEIPVTDLSDLEAAERQQRYDEIVGTESTRPFRLDTAPLMRMRLLKFAPDHHVLLQTIHHIVYDGWSLAVMYNELKAIYEAYIESEPNPLPPLEIQYADYAIWQNRNLESPELMKQSECWRQILAGQLPVLELVADKPRPAVQSYRGAFCKIDLSQSLSNALKALALKNDCTLSMLMLAAFKILIHRYTGETDILVGMPSANRNQRQTEPLIGFFVNTLVARTKLESGTTVEEVLSRVRASSSLAYSNQDVPFDRIVDDLQPERDISHNPIFQVMFAFQNTPELPSQIGGVDLGLEVLDNGTSLFDLTLNLHDSESGIYGYFEYCTELFGTDTIERMVGHYQTLLESMVSCPGCKVSELRLLPAREQRQLLVDWNATDRDCDIDRCIHDLIELQAAESPAATAISHRDEAVSYAELDGRANRLARYLQASGVGPEQVVGICMDRCNDTLISILAVLKAGGAYLPLDPSYPDDRLAFMLEDSGAKILITRENHLDDLPQHSAEVVCLDRVRADIAAQADSRPANGSHPDNLAYIIYTSGSTGRPKGVMITHRNLVHSTLARIDYYRRPVTKFLLLSSFAFDSSVAGIFWTLCQGGELHLPPQDTEKDITQVAQVLREARVSHMLSLPSVYGLLLDIAEPDQLQSLVEIIVAGEACPSGLANQHASVLPNATLYNEYGPTEGCVWSTVFDLSALDTAGEAAHQAQVPIGKPIANVKTYILDSHMQPVPIGVMGELYIGGKGIARGYLNRDDLTRERFLDNPFEHAGDDRLYRTGDLAKFQADANIQFCGRIDNQVKIRGYRIELGEIEATLLSHEGIQEAVVIARQDNSSARGSKSGPGTSGQPSIASARLVAYLVPADSNPRDTGYWHTWLKDSLPEYMVPHAFVYLDRIPLSPNGKVNVQALPEHDPGSALSSEYVEAGSDIEATLVDIWSSVLGVERVGIHDNFFEIGGDSILSIQVIARAKQAGIFLTPRQIFENLTVSGLAGVAKFERSISAEQGVVTGEVPLTPIQHWFLQRELPNPDHWNQAAMLRVPKDLDLDALRRALDQLLLQHDVLRTRFEKSGDAWRQWIPESASVRAIDSQQVSALADDARSAVILGRINAIQASLDIGKGEMLAAAHFDLGESDSHDRLFIAVHHLVVDTVSWTPLIEDLETAYRQLVSGTDVKLPEKTTSFREWAGKLGEYAQSDDARSELEYWLSLPDAPVRPLPLDFAGGDNSESSQRSVIVSLSREETEYLVKEVPPIYNTRIDDILLTAMAQAFYEWTGSRELSLGLEGHGREPIIDQVDLSRTVGWFTSYFPVSLALDDTSPGGAIRSIKEQLRKIPRHGVGFGILRYLAADNTIAGNLETRDQANLLYNYLGQIDVRDDSDAVFVLTDEALGDDHDQDGPRSHVLEVDAMVIQGRLRLEWLFSENLHRRETVEKLASSYIEALRNLLAHCQSPQAGGVSASDFPEANLDQDDLDDLLAMIND